MASFNLSQASFIQQSWLSNLAKWLPVLVGLLVMYVPTFQLLANTLWETEDQAHGPIILVVVLYLFWQKRAILFTSFEKKNYALGIVLLTLGLLTFAIGRSQEILLFEIGSLVPVLFGVLFITIGKQGVEPLWFAIFFTIFLIPLPGPLVDFLTTPLKHFISVFAENILYALDYPIARSGVTLSIGPYQLLVADACSGLHSMFSLSALGFLYLHLMQYKNLFRNSVIIASILPIAFLANLLRVITLILVTYYLGDEVGQGFVHEFAGLFLFVISLIFLFILDAIIGKFYFFKDTTTE